MGETGQARGLSDAARGRAVSRLAARRALKAFWTDRSGATAVEVGLFVVLISLAIVSALNLVSGGMKTAFTKTATAVAGT